MSDTPRTDAHCKKILADALGSDYAANELQYWAEDLEKELAAAIEQRDKLMVALKWLDASGGLGLDKHVRIREALKECGK